MRRLGSTLATLVVLVILVAAAGYLYYSKHPHTYAATGVVVTDAGSNISQFSAVFLTNGQVYFGKMYSDSTDQEVDLREIYYLQVNQNLQQPAGQSTTSNQQPSVTLVKLGNELHGPNDRMHINRQQILFIESMKSDSKVVSAINAYQPAK